MKKQYILFIVLALLISVFSTVQSRVFSKTYTTSPTTLSLQSMLALSVPDTDTVAVEICTGQSIYVNGVERNAEGFYPDALLEEISGDTLTILYTHLTIVDRPETFDTTHLCRGGSEEYACHTYTDEAVIVRYEGLANTCETKHTHVIVMDTVRKQLPDLTICEDNPYDFYGKSISESGTYCDTISGGLVGLVPVCDSIITINVTVLDTFLYIEQGMVCKGNSYPFEDTVFYPSDFPPGVYYMEYSDTLQTIHNCDSIRRLQLSLKPDAVTDAPIERYLCYGDTFYIGDEGYKHAYYTAGVFQDTVRTRDGLCDSIYTQITIDIAPKPDTLDPIDKEICTNDSIFIGGEYRKVAGSYNDTIFNAKMCPSKYLTYNLTVVDQYIRRDTAHICKTETVLVGCDYVNTPDDYTSYLTYPDKCDTMVITTVIIDTIHTQIDLTICDNDPPVTFGTKPEYASLITTGIYHDTLATATGCDSISTLNLTVNATSAYTLYDTICRYEYYNRNGFDLPSQDTPGDFTHSITVANACNCDSTVTLKLRVQDTSETHLFDEMCVNEVYNNHNFIISGLTVGEHIIDSIWTNSVGCDSLVHLHLNVKNISTYALSAAICVNESYDANGFHITGASKGVGVWTIDSTWTNSLGCDSIVTLTLTVRATSYITIPGNVCKNEIYNANGFEIAGDTLSVGMHTYYHYGTNKEGCDSTTQLNLQVVPLPDTTHIAATICSNQSYDQYDFHISGAAMGVGTHLIDSTRAAATGCDSVVRLTLTVNPVSDTVKFAGTICLNETYNQHDFTIEGTSLGVGTHTVHHNAHNTFNCDSVTTLILTIKPISETTLYDTVCINNTYANANPKFNNLSGWDTPSKEYTYKDTLNNALLCDSIITLKLFVTPLSDTTLYDTVCINNTYANTNPRFDNLSGWDTPNKVYTYRDTLANKWNCDSTITLLLYVKPTSDTTLYDTVCINNTYANANPRFNNLSDWDTPNKTYTYRDTLTNKWDCDSTITLLLYVKPTSDTTLYDTVCINNTYANTNPRFNNLSGWDTPNKVYTYRDTLTNKWDCDSTITLQLFVKPISTTILYDTVCINNTYANTNPKFNNLSGWDTPSKEYTYIDTLNNALLCDSIITLKLFVTPISDTTLYDTVCINNTYANTNPRFDNLSGWDTPNKVYTYRDTLANKWHCDSTITLLLYVKPTSDTTLYDTVCINNTYANANPRFDNISGWDTPNKVYTYRDTLTNKWDCDSTITLLLYVKPTSDTTLYDTVCINNTYANTNPRFDNLSGWAVPNTVYTYRDTLINKWNCDSTITLQLFVKPISTTILYDTVCINNTYANTNPKFNNLSGWSNAGEYTYIDTLNNACLCDSIITLHLTVHPISDTTLYDTVCINNTYANTNPRFNNLSGWDIPNKVYTYRDTLANKWHCDSTITLLLYVKPTSDTTLYDTICINNTYANTNPRFNNLSGWDTPNKTYTYRDTLTNKWDCDSTITLLLYVKPTSDTVLYDTVCINNTYANTNPRFDNISGWDTPNKVYTYRDTLTNKWDCDSTITLQLFVKPISTTILYDTVCINNTYANTNPKFNNLSGWSNAGEYTYIDTLNNACLCDSIITLHLTVHPISDTTLYDTVCINNTYANTNPRFNNLSGWITPDSTYTYRDTLANKWDCDSTITLLLYVKPTSDTTLYDTVCINNTYANANPRFNNLKNWITADSTYTYRDTLANKWDCDSTITLLLYVKPTSDTTLYDTVCINQTYTNANPRFNNLKGWFSPNTTYTYRDTLINKWDCDSTITLLLYVRPISTSIVYDTVCINNIYHNDNPHFDNISGWEQAGRFMYKDTLISDCQCDSIVTLRLFVKPVSDSTLYEQVCINDIYHNTNPHLDNIANWDTAGTYTYMDTVSNAVGCDSVITLQLTVLPTSDSLLIDWTCLNTDYTDNGFNIQNLNTAGTFDYYDTLPNQYGCDSVVHLSLTVRPELAAQYEDKVCVGDEYHNHGFNLTDLNTVGVFTFTNKATSSLSCDSVATLILTVNQFTINIGNDTAVCEGEDVVIRASDIAENYTWTINDNPYGTSVQSISVTIDEDKDIRLTAIDTNMCEANAQRNITLKTIPQADITKVPDPDNKCIITLVASPDDADTYVWNTGSNDENIAVTFDEVGMSAIYTVEVERNGCVAAADVTVNRDEFAFCDCEFSLPNTFTPNGDTYNDYFYPEMNSVISLTLIIYDRWGKEVFFTNDVEGKWDGNNKNGKECASGVYFCVVKYVCIGDKDKTITTQTSVTLLR